MGIMEKVPVKISYKELFFVFKRIFETSAGDLPDPVKLQMQFTSKLKGWFIYK